MAKPRRIKVPISYEYAQWTDEVAQGRIDRAKEFDRQPKYGQSKAMTPFDTRIGCKAEGAVAKYYGLEYDPGPDPDFHDVGGAEIRGTQYHAGKLIGHEGEEERTKQDMIFILCTGRLHEYFSWMVGWCYGHEMFKPEKHRDHFGHGRPSFAMAQEELKNINRLVCIDEIIQERAQKHK